VRDRPVLHGSEPDSPMVCAHSTGSRARRQALADSRRSEQDWILHAPSPPHTDILHDRRSGAVSAPAVLLHDRPPRYLLGDPAHHVGCVIPTPWSRAEARRLLVETNLFGGGDRPEGWLRRCGLLREILLACRRHHPARLAPRWPPVSQRFSGGSCPASLPLVIGIDENLRVTFGQQGTEP
jgi:hypothetical protein